MPLSHGGRQGGDVGGDQMFCLLVCFVYLIFNSERVNESDSFNPVCPKFGKRTIFQHAERVQVKVARVTWPGDTCDTVCLKLAV